MLPLVMYGIAEASTTRRPGIPCTDMLDGSTTDPLPVPILAVQEGCSAVSASLATQSMICWSVSTLGPGDSSPSLYSSKAGWFRMFLATRIASTHSRRSWAVDRELKLSAGWTFGAVDLIFTEPRV